MNGNQSKAKSHLVIQGIGLAYVAYLMISLISDYVGGKGEVPLPIFCLLIIVMLIAELILGWFAYRSWKRDQLREKNIATEDMEEE
ncbi:MAG: hypothetical protein LUE11_07535 [Clostridia bacterium]|nr:hypothetical protein [Clostridia bacterium]